MQTKSNSRFPFLTPIFKSICSSLSAFLCSKWHLIHPEFQAKTVSSLTHLFPSHFTSNLTALPVQFQAPTSQCILNLTTFHHLHPTLWPIILPLDNSRSFSTPLPVSAPMVCSHNARGASSIIESHHVISLTNTFLSHLESSQKPLSGTANSHSRFSLPDNPIVHHCSPHSLDPALLAVLQHPKLSLTSMPVPPFYLEDIPFSFPMASACTSCLKTNVSTTEGLLLPTSFSLPSPCFLFLHNA